MSPAKHVHGLGWSAIVCGEKRGSVSDHDMDIIDQFVQDRMACEAAHPGRHVSLDCPRCRRDLGFQDVQPEETKRDA